MTPTLRQLIEGARKGPYHLKRIEPCENIGYRYWLFGNGNEHGWSIAHICNAEDADATAQLIARIASPEVALAVLEALEEANKPFADFDDELIAHSLKVLPPTSAEYEKAKMVHGLRIALRLLNGQAQPSPAP